MDTNDAPVDYGSTHWDGCHRAGRKHYECALARIERLTAERDRAQAEARREFAEEAIARFTAEYESDPENVGFTLLGVEAILRDLSEGEPDERTSK